MKLTYEAYDTAGRTVSGVLTAGNPIEAKENLRERGLFVTNIAEVAQLPQQGVSKAGGRLGGGRRLKNLVFFTRQLYVLLISGTPLAEALSALENQSRDERWCQTVADVSRSVREGMSFSEALQRHPDCFDSVYTNLVRVGEVDGNLNNMLQRLADLTQKRQRIRSSIIGAMVYPALLIMVSIIVLIVLLTAVVPRFVELFESMDVPLPPTTMMLVVLSNLLGSYWWALVAVIVGLPFGIMKLLDTPAGKRFGQAVMLKAPVFGNVVRSLATASMVRLLGTLLTGHVSLVESLKLCREAHGNVFYAELLAKAEQSVTRGEPIYAAFEGSDLVPPSICEAIRNGEKTGQVGPLLLNVAGLLDDENDVVLRSLTSVLEPMILIVLGVVVGFVAVSLFIPLFDLTSMAGGSK